MPWRRGVAAAAFCLCVATPARRGVAAAASQRDGGDRDVFLILSMTCRYTKAVAGGMERLWRLGGENGRRSQSK